MMTHLAYGRRTLRLGVPDQSEVLKPPGVPALPDPQRTVRERLARPSGSLPLGELARRKTGQTACIVVSDITRPVPYRILLPPLLSTLETNGISRKDILILVATGMHRPSTAAERNEMLGEDLCRNYRVVDHVAADDSSLVMLPRRTSNGTQVSVDRAYVHADLKIATGLVEPHFMAGYSGGRKAICPGLVNLATIQKFHGPGFLENPNAATGILEGNPCHQEASDVAHLAGVDFLLNVAINLDRKIAGVFAGHVEAAFAEAVRFVDSSCRVALPAEADLVVTSGGGYPLDATFYQVVKGMVGAVPAVRHGGQILIAAECSEGVGSPEYRALMHEYSGRHDQFLVDILASPVVRKDQWELEMQCKVLAKVGVEGLIVCTPGISREELPELSVTSGYDFSTSEDPERMVQETLARVVARLPRSARIAVIPDGPYVIAGVA